MPINFRCPSGHKLNVADNLAGRKARCPVCRIKMYVPLDNSLSKQVARLAPETSSAGEEAVAQAMVADASPLAMTDGASLARPTPSAVNGYRPDQGKVRAVQLLAAALAAVAILNVAPALINHANLFAAPDWARFAVFIFALQLVYVVWIVSIPDWSTVWVGMLVCAGISALQAVVMAMSMFTPLGTPLPWGLSEVRHSAAAWCFAALALNGTMTYTCGRVAAQWRKACELSRLRLAMAQASQPT